MPDTRMVEAEGDMKEPDILERAKEAFALASQIKQLEDVMNRGRSARHGYQAHARNFNAILEKAKPLLSIDETIGNCVAHLQSYDDKEESNYLSEFEQIKSDLAMLRGGLEAFFEFHFPRNEKEKMGFRSRET